MTDRAALHRQEHEKQASQHHGLHSQRTSSGHSRVGMPEDDANVFLFAPSLREED